VLLLLVGQVVRVLHLLPVLLLPLLGQVLLQLGQVGLVLHLAQQMGLVVTVV
jgi:hypothetical protein